MSTSKQLLVSDLDGTLLDQQQQISPENKKAIQQFMKSGGIFTIATGRMLRATLPYIEELGITAPVILGNGTQLYCPNEQRLLESIVLTEYLDALNMLWQTPSEHAVMIAYYNDCIYTPRPHVLISAYEAKEKVTCVLRETLPHQVNKVLLIGRELVDVIHFAGDLSKSCVQSDSTYLEILPAVASKGNALQTVRSRVDSQVNQIIAIGDQLNDCSLLKAADRGYAVDNAHPELKHVATHQTVHHKNHAIAAVIHEMISPIHS